jgi:uncharacterized protein
VRLSRERVAHLAESLVVRLISSGFLKCPAGNKAMAQELERAISEELQVEDRLNAEVRQLMKAYEDEIERGGVDYQKMFTMIKTKLVKERGLIL